MEKNINIALSHKKWRSVAKKERRRLIRQKAAQERDADDERLRATLERSAGYLNWIEEQEKVQEEIEKKEAEERKQQKQRWLEAEVKAQKEWKELQERKAKARQEQLIQEEIIRKEFETKQEALRLKREELKRRQDEELQRHEDLQKEINDYIDHGTQTPEPLRLVIDSQPNKELCPFFTKTAACKYGDTCSRNHRRNALSKIIIIPGFYNHFSLEKNSREYDTDIGLEFESSETRRDFRDFYREIVPELETFGRIKTLRCCCNSEIHLRGNLYVEYYTEREAARAWRRLKGRYYAGRQLNCEFATLLSWTKAICGMTKCPKGRACNFLHTFRNPSDKYDVKSPPRWSRRSERESPNCSKRSTATFDESPRCNQANQRDRGWSESPEPEARSQRYQSEDRLNYRSNSKRDGRHSSTSNRTDSSSSSSYRSKKHKTSPKTPKTKKRRRSYDEKSKHRSHKHITSTDKENNLKNDLRKRSEKCSKHRSKSNDPSDLPSISATESKDLSQIQQKKYHNEWDTTDSEEDNYMDTK